MKLVQQWKVLRYLDDTNPDDPQTRVEWREDGKLNRPDSGPTVEISNKRGIVRQEWYNRGLREAPDLDDPAVIEDTGECVEREWYWQDKKHAEGIPAYTLTDKETGIILIEEWYFEDVEHRPQQDGPALVHRNRCGIATLESYIEHGRRLRTIERDGLSGAVLSDNIRGADGSHPAP